jgi:hypothetical protein
MCPLRLSRPRRRVSPDDACCDEGVGGVLLRSGHLLPPSVRESGVAAVVVFDEGAAMRGLPLVWSLDAPREAFCRGRDVACYAEARARLGMGRTVGLWKRNDVERIREERTHRRRAA